MPLHALQQRSCQLARADVVLGMLLWVVLQKLSSESYGREASPLVQLRPPLQTGWR